MSRVARRMKANWKHFTCSISAFGMSAQSSLRIEQFHITNVFRRCAMLSKRAGICLTRCLANQGRDMTRTVEKLYPVTLGFAGCLLMVVWQYFARPGMPKGMRELLPAIINLSAIAIGF